MTLKVLYGAAAIAVLGGLTALPAQASHDGQPSQVQPYGSNADDSVTSWASKCNYLGAKMMDPLKNHGADPGSAHLHQFYGSLTNTQFTALDNRMKSSTLQGYNPAGLPAECGEPDNVYTDPYNHRPADQQSPIERSLYWVPALFRSLADKTSQTPAQGAYALSYFRNEEINPHNTTGPAGDAGIMHAMPANFALAAGVASPAQLQPVFRVEWSCVVGNIVENNNAPAGETVANIIPESCPLTDGSTTQAFLRLIVRFPNCMEKTFWAAHINDPIGNFVDYSPHLVYGDTPSGGGHYALRCPAGYWPIPLVGVGARWGLDANGAYAWPKTGGRWDTSQALLDSDPDSVIGHPLRGETGHADFMNGWTPGDNALLMDDCFQKFRWDDTDPNFGHINCGIV